MSEELEIHTVPRNLYYHEVAYVRGLEADNKRLRALLHEARQYVSDAGNDEDGETQTLSAALLTEIDASLKDPKP